MAEPTAQDLINTANEEAQASEGDDVSIEEDFQALLTGAEEIETKFKQWGNAAKEGSVAQIYKRIASELIPLIKDHMASNAVAFNEVLEVLGEVEEGADEDDPNILRIDRESLDGLYRMCRTVNAFLNSAVAAKAFKGKAKAEVEGLQKLLIGVELSGKDTFGFERDEADEKMSATFDEAFKS